MTRTSRRGLLAFVGTVLLGRFAMADGEDAMGRPLRGLYDALLASMKAGSSAPFVARFDALSGAVEGAFDLETVLRVSVGMHWDTMDAETRTKLLTAFRRFTIATYVANFDKYDGEKFEILPGSRDSGVDKIVATQIVSAGQTIRMDYVMRGANGTWRVVDVLLDGSISRVAVQRSDFRKLLAKGDAELINSLNRKIADLSNGALSS
jgi:phospholipid transport system substrate-binding protein